MRTLKGVHTWMVMMRCDELVPFREELRGMHVLPQRRTCMPVNAGSMDGGAAWLAPAASTSRMISGGMWM